MPTKSNNTGGRGGARPGAGRKKSAVKDKAENGNPGGRKLEVLDIPEVEGVAMPKPHDFLSAEQRDGSVLQAQEIYTETWQWLKGIGCAAKVSPQLLERYAMCSARWVQCEEMTNRMGFLSKHPTTGKPIPSPFINIGINYMNQAVRLWNEIFQIVKENCSTEYGESTPQDDLMQTALPTDFDVNGSIRSAVNGVVGKAASAFSIALNITNFNNYSSEDIRQLTNEVMETANQFARRKGVVFA